MLLEDHLRNRIERIGTSEERVEDMRRSKVLGGAALLAALFIIGGSILSYGGASPVRSERSGSVAIVIGSILAIFPLMAIGEEMSVAKRKQRELVEHYGLRGPARAVIAPETYVAAARALRDFQRRSLEMAERNYGKEVVDILVMAGVIYTVPRSSNAWERVVSIRSIEEDREAGDED